MPDFGFQNLDTYHLAKMLVIETYKTTDTFSNSEKYGLSQQMNRAVVSVPSNIAEGISRGTRKDQVHFLNISYGSLMELACQSDISYKLGYITDKQRKELFAKINNLAIKINNFIAFIRKELKENL